MEFPAHFLLPAKSSHQAFLTAARGMLEKATAQEDVLIGEGMSGTLLDDLTVKLAEFEKTLEALRLAQGRLGPVRTKAPQQPEAGGSETLRSAQGGQPKAA